MKPLVLPQINLNGTSKQALVEQQFLVLSNLRGVLKAMQEASPHGRDYQLRPKEYPPARDAWIERMRAIEALLKEIEAHALAIHDAD